MFEKIPKRGKFHFQLEVLYSIVTFTPMDKVKELYNLSGNNYTIWRENIEDIVYVTDLASLIED